MRAATRDLQLALRAVSNPRLIHVITALEEELLRVEHERIEHEHPLRPRSVVHTPLSGDTPTIAIIARTQRLS